MQLFNFANATCNFCNFCNISKPSCDRNVSSLAFFLTHSYPLVLCPFVTYARKRALRPRNGARWSVVRRVGELLREGP